MFVGEYQPGIIRGITSKGRKWAGVELPSRPGHVVHRDTILLWMPPVPDQFSFRAAYDRTLPSEADVLHHLSLANLPRYAISHLEPPGVSFYDSFTRNVLRHPALVGNGSGFVVPTHGIPFAHSCCPNAICVVNVAKKTIEVRLTRSVEYLEPITLSYCPLTLHRTEREPYLKKFYGIEEHDCPKGCGQLCDWTSEKSRTIFFRAYVQLTSFQDRYDFVAEIKLACQIAKERHLEAYLWPLLSTAELYARNSDWYCRGRIFRALLAVIRIQAGSHHPSYQLAKIYEDDTSLLGDKERVDGELNLSHP